jgi:GntR family transcriptional regulator
MNIKKSRPLYFIIKEDIKEKILNGKYKSGDVLPTENSLCEEYKSSRVTIRRAINELIQENVLERGFGMTARVKSSPVPRSLNHLGGLQEELTQAGIMCFSYILNSDIIKADNILAEKMSLPVGEELYIIERLRYANSNPLCYQTIYLPVILCPDLDVKNLTKVSLYETIEKHYGLKISYAKQTIHACMANYKVAALLELNDLTCMLKINRTAYLDTNQCIEYSESYYVSDRYELSMTLNR